MKSKEFMDKDVFALDEKIGKIKEIEVDANEWKVTHLEVELDKNVAESVLGAKKGGVRNNAKRFSFRERDWHLDRQWIALKSCKRQTSHVPKTSS